MLLVGSVIEHAPHVNVADAINGTMARVIEYTLLVSIIGVIQLSRSRRRLLDEGHAIINKKIGNITSVIDTAPRYDIVNVLT